MSRLFIVDQINVGIKQAPSFSNIAELADLLKRSEQCCFSVRMTGTTDADITPAPIGEQSHVDQEESCRKLANIDPLKGG